MQRENIGWINGLVGVVIFSASLPATRVAVGGFSPLFLTSARAAIAALIGVFLLLLLKQPRPSRVLLTSLAITAIGVVVGFPLLTALALQHITSAHSIVFIGLLPLSTAGFAVLRGGERPKSAFWVFSIMGSMFVVGFALSQNADASVTGDILMLAAIILCGLGYAEGAKLSRDLGGWQVISWALALSFPLMATLALWSAPSDFAPVTPSQWFSLFYVSVFSMLIGFIFWYRGLAAGGIAAVGQLQLLQPFFGLTLAGLLLGEQISWQMLIATIAVVGCVAAAKRAA